MNDNTLKQMNELSKAHAKEKIAEVMKKIESIMEENDDSFTTSRENVKLELAKYLFISYNNGYADCYNNQKMTNLII